MSVLPMTCWNCSAQLDAALTLQGKLGTPAEKCWNCGEVQTNWFEKREQKYRQWQNKPDDPSPQPRSFICCLPPEQPELSPTTNRQTAIRKEQNL